jgi:hypothetical protein
MPPSDIGWCHVIGAGRARRTSPRSRSATVRRAGSGPFELMLNPPTEPGDREPARPQPDPSRPEPGAPQGDHGRGEHHRDQRLSDARPVSVERRAPAPSRSPDRCTTPTRPPTTAQSAPAAPRPREPFARPQPTGIITLRRGLGTTHAAILRAATRGHIRPRAAFPLTATDVASHVRSVAGPLKVSRLRAAPNAAIWLMLPGDLALAAVDVAASDASAISSSVVR